MLLISSLSPSIVVFSVFSVSLSLSPSSLRERERERELELEYYIPVDVPCVGVSSIYV